MSNNNKKEPDVEWPQEAVPDGDILFRRVHWQYAPDGELQPNAFSDIGPGMSTHWQKYCPTAADARSKAKNPDVVGVVSLPAGGVRLLSLVVQHAPSRNDRSHVTVAGEKTAEIRQKLAKLAAWQLLPNNKPPT